MANLSFIDAGRWSASSLVDQKTLVDFANDARAFGVAISSVVADGQVHRASDSEKSQRNGDAWYVCHVDGNLIYGAFGSWSGGGRQKTWCSHADSQLTEIDREKLEKSKILAQEKIRLARIQASETATAIIDSAPSAPVDHPYLLKKGVRSHDIRLLGDKLLIPAMRFNGEIATYQTIDANGEKRFLPGGGKQGTFFAFGHISSETQNIYMCEGWATAASVYEATNCPTLCAWDAGNLVHVAKGLRDIYPNPVVVCADNDANQAGEIGAKAVVDAIANASYIICPRVNDFNDLHQSEGIEAIRSVLNIERRYAIDLREWTASAYDGTPPPINWLAQDSLPLGVPGIAASVGGLGKSFMCLDACLAVANGDNMSPIFGGPIVQRGMAVFLTSEDSKESVHRRLVGIDPTGSRRKLAGNNLSIVPIPSAGGVQHIVTQDKNGISKTQFFRQIKEQIAELRPKLVIFDPLQAFTTADVNSDPAAGQYVYNCLSELCAETGATVLMMHHMTKDGLKGVGDLTEARAGIRGTSALVDGSRWSYALWPASPEDNKAICEHMCVPVLHQRVVFGGVVKANDKCNQVVRKYIRNDNGLLEDRTEEIDRFLHDRGERLGLSRNQEEEIINKIGLMSENLNGRQMLWSELIETLVDDYGMQKKVASKIASTWVSRGKIVRGADGLSLA